MSDRAFLGISSTGHRTLDLAFSRRGFLYGSAATVGAVLLGGCGDTGSSDGPTATSEPVAGGTLVLGSEAALESLDPSRQSVSATLLVTRHIYENLVTHDLSRSNVATPPVIGGVAESWEVADGGREYLFTLHPNITFHDGTPLDAAAVKQNFDRALDPSSPLYSERANAALSSYYRQIASTEAIDSLTLRVRLTDPFASFLAFLADPRLGIVSPTALERYGDEEIQQHPTGSGPFRFEARSGNTITLSRNPDYWGTAAHVDQVIFRTYEDASARVAALQSGDVDLIMGVPPTAVAMLEQNPQVVIEPAKLPGISFYMLNLRSGPTTDKLYRQALNWAVDRDTIIETVFNGSLAQPVPGPVSRANEVWDPSLEIYGYDPDRARSLLAQSGASGRLTILYGTTGQVSGSASAVTQILQQNLSKVGVEVELEAMENSALLQRVRGGLTDEVSAYFTTWNTNAEDPYWMEQLYGGNSQPPNGNNRGWYANPQVDGLLAQARVDTDPDRRVETSREAARLIAEDAPWIWMFQSILMRAYSQRLQGLVVTPSTYVDLSQVWLAG